MGQSIKLSQDSHMIKVNAPPLVLKARHPSGSASCMVHVGVPEQALEESSPL